MGSLFSGIAMSILRKNVTLSVAEYLAGEPYSTVKHEYVNGQVYAMVGVSRAHNRITVNLTLALGNHLRGTPCKVFTSDMKVRINDIFYYPDLAVGCGESNPNDYYLSQPVLVIEVLSPSTERLDLVEKRLNYQSLPSLHEYVLVAQDKPEVRIFRRAEAGWDLEIFAANDTVRFQSVDLAVPIAEIYEDVESRQEH
ncbi:MAG: Uma2 family endonuclease [Gammaproteobacteria bacterium]